MYSRLEANSQTEEHPKETLHYFLMCVYPVSISRPVVHAVTVTEIIASVATSEFGDTFYILKQISRKYNKSKIFPCQEHWSLVVTSSVTQNCEEWLAFDGKDFVITHRKASNINENRNLSTLQVDYEYYSQLLSLLDPTL
jgi:hypothetical protein